MKKLLEEARDKGDKQDLAQQDLQDSAMRQSAFGVPPSLEVQSPFDPSPNAIASPPLETLFRAAVGGRLSESLGSQQAASRLWR